MIVLLVKTCEIELDTDDAQEALEIVNSMDACGSLEMDYKVYNSATSELIGGNDA